MFKNVYTHVIFPPIFRLVIIWSIFHFKFLPMITSNKGKWNIKFDIDEISESKFVKSVDGREQEASVN